MLLLEIWGVVCSVVCSVVMEHYNSLPHAKMKGPAATGPHTPFLFIPTTPSPSSTQRWSSAQWPSVLRRPFHSRFNCTAPATAHFLIFHWTFYQKCRALLNLYNQFDFSLDVCWFYVDWLKNVRHVRWETRNGGSRFFDISGHPSSDDTRVEVGCLGEGVLETCPLVSTGISVILLALVNSLTKKKLDVDNNNINGNENVVYKRY